MAISYSYDFTLSTGNKAYVGAEATVTNGTTSSSISVSAGAYLTNGWVQSTGIVAKIYINNVLVSTKTILGNGTKYTATAKKTVSASKSITKTTSAQSISWKVEFWQYTDGVEQSLKKTVTGTASVSAKTKYTITYNSNGGSSTPTSQTKWHGTAITLAAAITKTGYTFQGWSTTQNGGVSYKAGASYTANASVTLYAVWKANTYTIEFNVNGGSGTISNQTKTHGVTLVLTKTTPTRANYTFLGWSTSSTATSATYTAGGNFTSNANTTLYAVWKLSYVKPKISSLSVNRCNSGKTLTDTGTYALVGFSWTTSIANPTITIQWKLATATSYPSGNKATITGSGTSGTVSQLIGANALSVDSTYTIYIKVADSTDYSETTKPLSGQKYLIDRLSNNNGISFGKPAELSGYTDLGFKLRCRDTATFDTTSSFAGVATFKADTKHDKHVILANNMHIYGCDVDDGSPVAALMPVTNSGNTSLGYGLYNAGKGNTYIYGTNVKFYTKGGIYTNGNPMADDLLFNNNVKINAKDSSGNVKQVFNGQSDGNNTAIGHGNYAAKSGNTNIYGHDILHFVSNIATPGSYRPYRRRGDTVTFRWPGSGFVTSSGKQVHFFIPFSVPILGSPTVSLTSSDGFILRQNGKYTHGSGAETRIKPDSYTTTLYSLHGIRVYATFSDTTNVTNNDSIGIDWIGTIVFS